MNGQHVRAAALGALFRDPSLALAMAMRELGPDAAWDALEQRHPQIPSLILERWRRLEPQRMVDRALAGGARLIVEGDPDWPLPVNDLGPQKPWALWARGKSLPAHSRAVAIVGARSCTAYGERTASELAAALATAGHPVVSGGAYGIDAAAHRGALIVDGCTVAVLACGVDTVYPSAHSALFERIAERGLLLSEAPPGTHPTKPAFLIRNRIIAALAYGTVVVEARVRSGSFSTYAHARALRRVLMAVPGPIDSAESAGANALIQDDAQLVTSGTEIRALIAPLGSVDCARQPRTTEWDELGHAERLVHEALPARRPMSVDALMDEVREPLDVPSLLSALAALAQRGILAESLDGQWRRIRALRGAAA